MTKEIARHYITGDSKVILCSLPASEDLVTNYALKLAAEVDPKGERTLGVLTRIDQAGKGIGKKLEGTDEADFALSLGLVGNIFILLSQVRCRTPEETDEGATLEQVQQLEEELFRDHNELKHVDDSLKGVPALLQKLVEIQRKCLTNHLPEVRRKVDKQIRLEKETLDKLPDVIENEDDALAEAKDCVRNICEEFEKRAKCDKLDTKNGLQVSAKVAKKFNEFSDEMDKISGGIFKDEVWDHIQDMNREIKGVHLPNVLPIPVLDAVLKEYLLNNLSDPPLALVQNVQVEVEGVLSSLIADATKMYPKLSRVISAQLSRFLEERRENTEYLVKECINSQSECIATTRLYKDTLEEMKAIKYGSLTRTGAWIFPKGSEEHEWFRAKASAESEDMTSMEILCTLGAHAKTVSLLLAEQVPKFVRRNLVLMLYENRALEKYLGKALDQVRSTLYELMGDERQAKKRNKSEKNLKNLKIAREKLMSAVSFGGY
ncbi:hypothetical protein BSKO_02503 [Bryopsis sp. KO-2023]|nr:hypothetical protein BSKO_02503 [Bryopsis sp. KO-2023]